MTCNGLYAEGKCSQPVTRVLHSAHMDDLDDTIQYYEAVVDRKQKEHDALWGKNPTSPTAPVAYANDVLPYKHLLRLVYIKAGRPICWGGVDCLEKAYQKCAAGKHETCLLHVNDCLACKAEK